MLTLSKIIGATPQNVKDSAREVGVALNKAVTDGETTFYSFKARSKGGKDTYTPQIVLTGTDIKKTQLPRSKAWVTCTCSYFKFNCEAALTKHGSSSIIHTKGYKPKGSKRGPVNPRMIPQICKHLVKVVSKMSPTTVKQGNIPLDIQVQREKAVDKYIPKK